MKLYRNCPVCNKKMRKIMEHISMNVPEDYHLPDSYNIVVCEQCGMVYADTSATMEDYDWYYTNCNFYGDDSKDGKILQICGCLKNCSDSDIDTVLMLVQGMSSKNN